ncbi:hypothetical protein ACFLIM_46195 [Nonomuraea sp. M3C6]|uniref:Uncharacterized protein n=1 Tax=Nonomuraea marmarensis TaxID=3351344 RepID=A0ABW7AT29_9ACTN
MRTWQIGTFGPSVVLGVATATGALDDAGLAITHPGLLDERFLPGSAP